MNKERRKLLVKLGKTRKQIAITDTNELLNLTKYNCETVAENSILNFQEEYNESLPNISTGFFDKHQPLEDEVMTRLMDDLGVSVLNKTKPQTDRIEPTTPCISPPILTPSNSQSTQIHANHIEDDITEKMSITPIPSENNSFTSSPSHDLLEPNQTGQSVNFDIDSIESVVTCQSPIITTTDASSAADASSECSTPTNASGRKRRQFYIDRSKKKRLRNKDNWIDIKRKLLLNSGKQHLSRNGKIQPAKCIKPPCDVCKFKCNSKISFQERKNIFDRFWGLSNHEQQWVFISKYAKRYSKKRITTENDSKRNFSVTYNLPVDLDKSSPRSVKVCKTMFKNTLSISNQFIMSALDKYDKTTGNCSKDLRGHHNNKTKINTAAVIQGVCDHVRSFQPVESHYIRKDSSKLYLSGDLNFSIMFQLYKEWAEENNILERVRTVRQYRDIVNKEMNICFFIPKKDQCDVCTAFKNCPDTQPAEKFEEHMKNKDVARSLKKQDKIKATTHPETITSATFDFQKILSTPHGETSSFYYKRKLSIFNFTVFEMGLKKGICYMWPETIAKRGSNEVASCLLHFIENSARKGIKDVRLWSDNCGGQNRNRAVFFMYAFCSSKFKIDICHRFLEKGHTQQEGDSVHAMIEKSSKRKSIYSPEEWYTLVRWCKTSGDPYEVINITQNMFLDFKGCLDNLKWDKNTDNETVKWSKIREVVVKSDFPNTIFYKYNLHEEESKRIDLLQKRNTRSRRDNILNEPNVCYDDTLMITHSKYNDLVNLCEQNLIPFRYHEFYKNLKHACNSYTQENN
ncbi:uncharacterized protein LOC132903184 [Amyelois transitella]|uniref:uncharacterized protein LOC132903160 n=1 Tax=Amyelois transitella TaxID=680683 RepID=UPI00298FF050|nr:uncharacterized protein LOC132903160 [Amyelois transitella]XP_060806729.1 uncharacterized protein LOC132903184 [Amyelois transitella]